MHPSPGDGHGASQDVVAGAPERLPQYACCDPDAAKSESAQLPQRVHPQLVTHTPTGMSCVDTRHAVPRGQGWSGQRASRQPPEQVVPALQRTPNAHSTKPSPSASRHTSTRLSSLPHRVVPRGCLAPVASRQKSLRSATHATPYETNPGSHEHVAEAPPTIAMRHVPEPHETPSQTVPDEGWQLVATMRLA